MSHMTTLKLEMTDRNCLEEALKNMGCKFSTGRVRGYGGSRHRTADISVDMGRYDLGFFKNDPKDEKEPFQVTGDMYEIFSRHNGNGSREQWFGKLLQQYTLVKDRKAISRRGLSRYTKERTMNDGTVELKITLTNGLPW